MLLVAAGIAQMKWAMRCSIAGLQGILGPNEPASRSCQPDMEKFLALPVSYERRQLGFVTNTCTMTVMSRVSSSFGSMGNGFHVIFLYTF
jgi:hypothetical protein